MGCDLNPRNPRNRSHFHGPVIAWAQHGIRGRSHFGYSRFQCSLSLQVCSKWRATVGVSRRRGPVAGTPLDDAAHTRHCGRGTTARNSGDDHKTQFGNSASVWNHRPLRKEDLIGGAQSAPLTSRRLLTAKTRRDIRSLWE